MKERKNIEQENEEKEEKEKRRMKSKNLASVQIFGASSDAGHRTQR